MPPSAARQAARRYGQAAEQQVRRSLEASGWAILATNWRGGGGELDLVAAREGRLRIVEVKARSGGGAIQAVHHRKRQRLIRAAEAFLARYRGPLEEVSFSIAILHGDQLTWIHDAFDG